MITLASAAESAGIITSILALLVLARVLGEIMARLNMAPVVGEIMAGLLLGPAVFKVVTPTAELNGIAELSVFLILLKAGMEMDFRQVMRAFLGRLVFLGAISFIIPLLAGFAAGVLAGFEVIPSIILALCIAITALPVIVRIMDNFGILDANIGRYAIATAIFNDIAALFFLGVLLGLGSTALTLDSLATSIAETGGNLLTFGAIILVIALFLFLAGEKTGYIRLFLSRMIQIFGKEALFGLAILFVLTFGAMSEKFSSHFVIGVFFGGLLITKESIGDTNFERLEETLNSVSSGFLAPIFFGYIGLQFSWEPLMTLNGILFAIAIIIISIFSKIFASRLGGRVAGISSNEAMGVGIVLNSRGTMDLVVADIARSKGLIEPFLFSNLVLLGVVSTVVTPFLFKRLVHPEELTGGGSDGDPEPTSGPTSEPQSEPEPQPTSEPEPPASIELPPSSSEEKKDDGHS